MYNPLYLCINIFQIVHFELIACFEPEVLSYVNTFDSSKGALNVSRMRYLFENITNPVITVTSEFQNL